MSPHRAIDLPLEELPAIDEHAVEIEASADQAWEALLEVVRAKLGGRLAEQAARSLGCEATASEGEDFEHPGGTLPGFVVSRSIPPVMLAMLGEHRYSAYALVFRIDLLGEDRCRLRAETRAKFPGRKGRIYKALVIGSHGHVFTVMRVLRAVKKQAEKKAQK